MGKVISKVSSADDPSALVHAVGRIISAEHRPDDIVPMFDASAVAAALVARGGRVICSSAAFRELGAAVQLDRDLTKRVSQGAPATTALVELGTDGGAADTAIFVYARASQAAAWRLPADVQRAAMDAPDSVVVLTSHVGGAGGPLEAACRSYGLSGLQTRVALETVRTGDIRASAEKLGISFHTAREALAEVMRRVRAPKLQVMVRQLASLAFGVLPEENAEALLTDAWGLSLRQANIAGLIASGLSRGDTARTLGLSEAVVKKDLDQAYQALQVSSAAALARKLVEANALHWLMRTTRGDIGFVEAGAEPLRFVHRPDGSRIAVSDYGPASGRPVLVAHSSMTSRPVSRGLVRALQAAGYRPLAIDRPGFGMTDEVAGRRPGQHDPYETAAADAVLVLDSLKIPSLDLVGRGAAKFVMALQDVAPSRLRRVVLVNPGLHAAEDRRRTGLFGLLKDSYNSNPAAISLWISWVSRQMTYDRFAGLMQHWMRDSVPDQAASEDPEIVRDYFRAQRMFATGRVSGYVNEQTEYVRGSRPRTVSGTFNWRVLLAAHDTLHEPSHALAYWQTVLPDAQFRVVEDAGRLLALSHPHYVVQALTDGP